MKIGIITFWQSEDNYGQVLQCYALQKFLEQLGHEPYLIRFSLGSGMSKPSFRKRLLKIIKIYPMIQYFIAKAKKRKDSKYNEILQLKNKQRQFDKFRAENIKSTEKIYNSIQELRRDPPVADCYVTGSDQVWVMLLDQEDNKAYFLDFGDETVKRISYAASFSREFYPVELQPELRNQLRKFDAISVREDVGVEICKQVGCDAIKVLDPTLLLQKSAYFTSKKEANSHPKFFYVYSINIRTPKDIYWDGILRYADEKNIEPVITTSSGHFPGREIFGNVKYSYSTIDEWFQNINDAEFVVTTSFHGVVFCLIFNKNFIYFPLKGHHSRGNNRVISLLRSVNLEEKMCQRKIDIPKCIETQVNWEDVNQRIEKMKSVSIQFLKDSLN